jgi:hypothetical protein
MEVIEKGLKIKYLSSLNMLFDTATLYPKEEVSSSSSLFLLLHRFCIPHPIAVITRRGITPEDIIRYIVADTFIISYLFVVFTCFC